ncbi:MAG: IS1595 family transposase [Nitrospira sp. CG24D]|nr:MAG: IS1595 family transposase [Nitrospira sp. CG24D]
MTEIQETPLPKTLQQAVKAFADEQFCIDLIAAMRWADGQAVCPKCSQKNNHFMASRKVWQCKNKECKKQFSVKVGTIFEDSAIALEKWLLAMWMMVNAKNGISSYEIHRSLGVTQKTAWFMMHRIRLVLQNGSLDRKLTGEVEADETYIGGKARNMHKDKQQKALKAEGYFRKAVVMGMLERDGEVRTKVLNVASAKVLAREIRANVEPGSTLYTDQLASYTRVGQEYAHHVINHAQEYVRGNVHTNGIENFWSLLKRGIKGTYVSVEPFHLFRYLDEQSFRFNTRKSNDQGRFISALSSIQGKRVEYKDLIGQTKI